MLLFGFSLPSEVFVRLPSKSFQPVPRGFSSSRTYAAKDMKFISPYTKYKMILAEAMCNETRKIQDSKMAAGVELKDLTKGIKMARGVVSESLSSRARMISKSEEIAQVATTWAHGDKKIGGVIAKALEKIGRKKGHIFISSQEWKASCIKLIFYSGMKLDQGYISSCFVTNKKEKICAFNDPRVFIFEKKLSDIDVVMEILRLATRRPVVIVAEDFENDVLDTLITNKLTIGAKVCAIKSPGHGETRNLIMEELLDLTKRFDRNKVITEKDCTEFVYPLGVVKRWPKVVEFSGTCSAVIVSKNDTVFLDDALDIRGLEKEISKELQLGSPSDSITGIDWLYAVIKVGGSNKKNVGKNIRMLTHALVASLSAMEEGIVPGAGVGFLNASKELDKLQTTTLAQKLAVQIIQNALKMPMYTIASAAGVEGSHVVGKLLDQDNLDIGYDARRGEFVDMLECGIVDPLKLVREAFEGATSLFLKRLRKRELAVEREGRYWSPGILEMSVGTVQGKAM